jgi:hypothetical protein
MSFIGFIYLKTNWFSYIFNLEDLRSSDDRECSLKNSSVLIYFVVIEWSSGHDVEDDWSWSKSYFRLSDMISNLEEKDISYSFGKTKDNEIRRKFFFSPC